MIKRSNDRWAGKHNILYRYYLGKTDIKNGVLNKNIIRSYTDSSSVSDGDGVYSDEVIRSVPKLNPEYVYHRT